MLEHNGVAAHLTNSTGQFNIQSVSNLLNIQGEPVRFSHGSYTKLETTGYGVTVTGGLSVSGVSTFQDDINVGAGKSISWDVIDDFHITTTSGHGLIETNNELYFGAAHLYIQKPGGTTTMAEFIQDGAVKLNHNNITKLETHDYGIDVTGHTETDTLNVSGVTTTGTLDVEGNTSIGIGGTVFFADTSTQKIGINTTSPAYALDVVGDINSSTDIKINGVSVLGGGGGGASLDDVVALAIALG